MDSLILSSATVGIVISLLAYEIGLAAQRKWKLAVLKLSADTGYRLSCNSSVSAAGSSEEKYRSDPDRSSFRSSGKPWICPCNGSAFWTGSQTVCDHAA